MKYITPLTYYLSYIFLACAILYNPIYFTGVIASLGISIIFYCKEDKPNED